MTPPVVWVPGHLCGGWLYEPQIAALPGRAAMIAEVERDDSIAAMAARLLGAAPERFVLAGLSMGGMVAMEAMAAAPERVAGAVLLDTDPFAARPVERAFRAEQRAAIERDGLEGPAAAFVARFFAHDAVAAERLAGPCLARMAATPVAVYRAQADALNHRRDMLPRLGGFAAPVAVIVGARDTICPPKLHAALAEALPGATLTVIPDTGHLATLEAPEPVNTAIAALLGRIEGGRPQHSA